MAEEHQLFSYLVKSYLYSSHDPLHIPQSSQSDCELADLPELYSHNYVPNTEPAPYASSFTEECVVVEDVEEEEEEEVVLIESLTNHTGSGSARVERNKVIRHFEMKEWPFLI